MKKIIIIIAAFILLSVSVYVYAVGPSGYGGSGTNDWNDLTNVPAGFADDTDDESTFGAWGSSSEVTIASGVAALTGEGYYSIDTQNDDASDDLTKVTGLADGDEVVIMAEHDDRTIVVTDGSYLLLNTGANFSMNNTKDRIRLQCIGSDVCVELSRSSGGD